MHMSPRDRLPIGDPGGQHSWVDAGRYSLVQRFFLARIEHLVALRKGPNQPLEPWQNALLNRAIYSTYRDCLEQGLVEEARLVLRPEGSSQGTPSS